VSLALSTSPEASRRNSLASNWSPRARLLLPRSGLSASPKPVSLAARSAGATLAAGCCLKEQQARRSLGQLASEGANCSRGQESSPSEFVSLNLPLLQSLQASLCLDNGRELHVTRTGGRLKKLQQVREGAAMEFVYESLQERTQSFIRRADAMRAAP